MDIKKTINFALQLLVHLCAAKSIGIKVSEFKPNSIGDTLSISEVLALPVPIV